MATTSLFASHSAPVPAPIGGWDVHDLPAPAASGYVLPGLQVTAFEEAFAQYADARHAVAVSSGAVALHLSLLAAGIERGDEVVTTPLADPVAVDAIMATGATPVFADIDALTLNLNPREAAGAMTARTRAILPAHFAGRPADMPRFRELAERHGVTLIEDATHCLEGVAAGQKVGSIGHFTCFDFSGPASVTTGGGAMVTTEDDRAAAFIRAVAFYAGRTPWRGYTPEGGAADLMRATVGVTMTDSRALVGIRRLSGMSARAERRSTIWERYDRAFAGLPFRCPAPSVPGDVHACQHYTVLVDGEAGRFSRDTLADGLRQRGLSRGPTFRALSLDPRYQQRLGLRRGMFPVAAWASDRLLSLPLSASMTDSAVAAVIEAIHDLVR